MKKILILFVFLLISFYLNGQVVINRGSSWKYNASSIDMGTTWKDVGFNDATWSTGNALLGYGVIDAETIITTIYYGPNPDSKYPTYYFRKTFNCTKTGYETYYEINTLIDDGAVFYINGIEIKRLNMPTGTITYNTWAPANGNEISYQQFNIPASYIQNGSNTIAVELHQYTASSTDVGFNMDLIARTSSLTSVSQIHFGSTNVPLNGLTITWRNQQTTDSIKWGYNTSYLSGKYAGTRRSNYADYLFDYSFPQLIKNTVIHYSIWDSYFRCWTPDKVFYTAMQKDANHFTFNTFGDSQTNWDDWNAISNAVKPSDFVLFLGDLVDAGGTTSYWDTWFAHGTDFFEKNTVYYAIGNHDISGDASASNYRNLMVMPPGQGNELYYSFTVGNAVFICLNSNDAGNTIQYNWLINTLESNKDKKWRIVFFHKPFYSSPSSASDMATYFSTWWKTFDDFGVELILNGHAHNYERTYPINRNISTTVPVSNYGNCMQNGRCQIVAGPAGATVSGVGTGWFMSKSFSIMNYVNVSIVGDSLICKAYDRYNVVIDSFMIIKTLNAKIFVEGLYDAGTGIMREAYDEKGPRWGIGIVDTIRVELHSVPDYGLVKSYHTHLLTDGTFEITSAACTLNNSYYITVFQRNSVPLTTATPISFAGSSLNYDFTGSANQAYGPNTQKELGSGIYGMYTGEVNHDVPYLIDGDDIVKMLTDIPPGLVGYYDTDLNGNGLVDGNDLVILLNNIPAGVYYHHP